MSVAEREEMALARLRSLAPHLGGDPDPAFRTATRARLVAMAAVRSPQPAPGPGSPTRRLVTGGPIVPARWRARLRAGLAAAALTLTALATVVALSTDARPGDALYAVKRGTEQAQLALAGDARGEVLLGLARTRLEELRIPGGDAGLVVATLGTMDAQTAEGAGWLNGRAVATEDRALLETLDDWAEAQSGSLAAVRADMPPGAHDEIADSLALLADIGHRTDGLRASIDCPAGPATAGSDDLGPVPGPCLPDQDRPPAAGGDTGAGPDAGTPPGTGAGTPPGTGDPSVTAPGPSLPSPGDEQPVLPGTDQPDEGVLDPLLPPAPPPDRDVPTPGLTMPGLPGTTAQESGPVEGTTIVPDPRIDVCLPPVTALGDC